MKTITTLVLLAGLSLSLPRLATAQPTANQNIQPPAPPAAISPDNEPQPAVPAAPAAAAAQPAPAQPASAASNAVPATIVSETGTNGLRMNFRGAPLNQVLDYLVDAAGFIINKRPDVRGTVEISSNGPVTRDEAVELLNLNLKQNGYGVSRNGRILTIYPLESAKTADIDINQGNNPDDVPKSDQVVTQIIPVRYASVGQLVANLNELLPTSANLSANESANSLILTATQTDIKRMLKIITALDTSIASVSSIKVIPLRYADAKDMATLITQLFTPQSSTQGNGGGGGRANLFNMFGGGRGGFGGGGGGGAATSGRSSPTSGAAATRVAAVGDDRSNSVIISAPADLLVTIEEMVEKIDQPVTDVTELRVFKLTNADPSETADQLAQLFPDDTATTGNQNNVPFFMRGPFGGGRGGNANSQTGTSDRTKKMGRVVAVPDPRTGSLIVTASKSLMPEIAEMIATLDANAGRREVVSFYELQNADPQDVYQNLQDLFNRSTVRMQNNNNSRSMLGTANPLSTRETSTANQTSGTTTTSGGSSGRGGSGISTGF